MIRFKSYGFSADIALKAFGLITLALLATKAAVDVDISYDSWYYHLPLAARLWGIVPKESFNSEYLELLYRGYPLLCEYIQGFLWYFSGRPESANLLGLASLVSYILFLKRYFNIPTHIAFPALLAVPMVQTHTTISYVDLPGNIAVSVLVLMTLMLYTRPGFLTARNLIVMIVAGAFAVNTKFLLAPVVFMSFCFIGFRILKMAFEKNSQTIDRIKWTVKILPLAVLIVCTVFATPVKNLVVHQNPVYPIELKVAGITFNHVMKPTNDIMPSYLMESPRGVRWILSLAEIGIHPINRPNRWTHDQWMSPKSAGYRMGGYFHFYVLAQMMLFGFMCVRLCSKETHRAAIGFAFISVLTAFLPQSHELRYYMYWIIILISLNLYLVARYDSSRYGCKWITLRSIGFLGLAAFFFVAAVTRANYILPRFYSFDRLIEDHVDMDIINQLKSNSDDEISLADIRPCWQFLYAAEFHPPSRYSIKEGKRLREKGASAP